MVEVSEIRSRRFSNSVLIFIACLVSFAEGGIEEEISEPVLKAIELVKNSKPRRTKVVEMNSSNQTSKEDNTLICLIRLRGGSK